MNSYEFRNECIEMSIKFYKKNCNSLLLIMIISISVILINAPLIYFGTINTLSAICTGMMIITFLYTLSEYSLQKMELKHKIEMKHIYNKYDTEKEERDKIHIEGLKNNINSNKN